MPKILVIGSTVCDVMIYLDRLPSRQGDAHIKQQVMSVGGCAFNVAHLLHQLQIPYQFISPVGTGLYGDFVAKHLEEIGMPSLIRLTGENGCCYCFVEEDGERTFLSNHGVEYSFDVSWLDNIDIAAEDYIYICGLEVEEETGRDLISALEKWPAQLVFAPGPRGHLISPKRLERLWNLSPIVHLSDDEIKALTKKDGLSQAMISLYERTGNTVLVTIGERGVLAYDGRWYDVPAYRIYNIKDTIGAGDSHVGAVLAALSAGRDLDFALDFANQVSSQIVQTSGVRLSDDTYQKLRELFHEKE